MVTVIPDAEMQKLVGERLDKGNAARRAYEVKGHPDRVIKLAERPYANCREAATSEQVKDTKWNDVFGECFAISKSGKMLMMERLDDIDKSQRADTPTLPSIISDIWPNNFGVSRSGTIKVRDYDNLFLNNVLEADLGQRTGWQIAADRGRAER